MIKNKLNTKTIESRLVAFLCSDGVDDKSVNNLKAALEKEGATAKIIGTNATAVTTSGGNKLKVDHSIFSCSSVLFDAVFIPSGKNSIEKLKKEEKVPEFLNDAYKHCKVIGAEKEGQELLNDTNFIVKLSDKKMKDYGVITDSIDEKNLSQNFIDALGNHRFWIREN